MKFKWFCLFSCSIGVLLSAHAESVVFARPGKNGAEVIQQAIDALPNDRRFIGTVRPVGTFCLEKSLVLLDYTRLDFSEAQLVLADGARVPMIVNADHDKGNRYIEITGGVLNGNSKGQGPGDFHGILFVRAEQVRISDLDVVNCSGDGIRVNGKGRHTRNVQLRNLRLLDNNRCGLNVMWASRTIFVSDIYAGGNREVGIRSDHSEGLYQNICADSNRGDGIFIRNIFGGTYNNLIATRNGGMGIHVQGMVCSQGSNWGAHNNSMDEPGKFADIFFDANAKLSYGISQKSVLNNIVAGPYSEYGPASEKTAVEFGEGVRDGLQISNLLEHQ